jgi:hypothetical protein
MKIGTETEYIEVATAISPNGYQQCRKLSGFPPRLNHILAVAAKLAFLGDFRFRPGRQVAVAAPPPAAVFLVLWGFGRAVVLVRDVGYRRRRSIVLCP